MLPEQNSFHDPVYYIPWNPDMSKIVLPGGQKWEKMCDSNSSSVPKKKFSLDSFDEKLKWASFILSSGEKTPKITTVTHWVSFIDEVSEI